MCFLLTLSVHAHRGLLYLVCVSVCLSPLILALQGPSRLISNTNGSSATRARKVTYVAILLKRRHSRDMALKQATKPPTSTDHYRFRLSGTLAVLRWRGTSAWTIARFQQARGMAIQWGGGGGEMRWERMGGGWLY